MHYIHSFGISSFCNIKLTSRCMYLDRLAAPVLSNFPVIPSSPGDLWFFRVFIWFQISSTVGSGYSSLFDSLFSKRNGLMGSLQFSSWSKYCAHSSTMSSLFVSKVSFSFLKKFFFGLKSLLKELILYSSLVL